MQLKRGWWKQRNGEYAFLAGEHNGRWYGVNSKGASRSWDSNGIAEFNNDDIDDDLFTYCGDGPKPVEPVQLCLGWWERADGSTTKFVGPSPEVSGGRTYEVWRDSEGNRYNADGSPFWATTSKGYTIAKRRPDLDAKEAEQNKPDPRDAEIAKLTMDICSLTVRVDNQKSVIDRLNSRLATIQTEYNNLARIIGDH